MTEKKTTSPRGKKSPDDPAESIFGEGIRNIVGGLTKLGASGWLRTIHDDPQAVEFLAAYIWAQEDYEGQDAAGLKAAWAKLSVADRKTWKRRVQATLTGVNAWVYRPEEP